MSLNLAPQIRPPLIKAKPLPATLPEGGGGNYDDIKKVFPSPLSLFHVWNIRDGSFFGDMKALHRKLYLKDERSSCVP